MLVNKLQSILIGIFLCVIPFHTLCIVNIIDVSVIGFWKEGILIILLILYLLNMSITNKFDFLDALLVSTIAYFIFMTALSSFKISALYGLRNLVEPLLLLLVVRNIKVSVHFFEYLVRCVIVIGVLISLFGIYQCIFLGDQFLLDLGYSSGKNGKLHHSFYFSGGILQRNVGTFSSANDFGLFLVIVIILLSYYRVFTNKIIFRLVNFVLYLSLLLTFSRSAILGLGLYLLVANPKTGLKIISLISIAFILLNIYYSDMLSSINKFFLLTMSGKDPSIQGHIDSLLFSFDLLKDNFLFGLEMGRVGPKASIFFNTMIDVESSFFCLLFDVGIIGFIFYIITLICFMGHKLNLLIMIAMFPAFFLLPVIYELEVMFVLYIFMGLISVNKR